MSVDSAASTGNARPSDTSVCMCRFPLYHFRTGDSARDGNGAAAKAAAHLRKDFLDIETGILILLAQKEKDIRLGMSISV